MAKRLDIFGNDGAKAFYMRDFKNAYRFRADVNPPRQAFQGYVNFILNRDFFSFLFSDTGNDSNEFRTQISSTVRTADLPAVQFKTETRNKYNRKKIVNTGVEYDPVSMTVIDTVGNEWLITLMKYFTYHYMDARNQSVDKTDRDISGVSRKSDTDELTRGDALNPPKFMSDLFDSNAAGYNLNQNPYFFERIDYVLYHGNQGVQYSLLNPVITSFKPTPLDYSSSDVREFGLSFAYEKFTIHNATNFSLSTEDVDRFENVSDLTGPAFEPHNQPAIMVERELEILGSQTAERKRTDGTRTVPTFTEEASFEGPPLPSVRTYGIVTASTGTGQQDTESKLTDVIEDVADAALTAAIHGGDIVGAAVNSAVGGLAEAINPLPESPLSRGELNLPGD